MLPLLGANEENAIVERAVREKQLPCLVAATDAAVKMFGARFVINQCAVRSHKTKSKASSAPKIFAAMFSGNATASNELSFRLEKVP